jgi:hypothetical protein
LENVYQLRTLLTSRLFLYYSPGQPTGNKQVFTCNFLFEQPISFILLQ